jgi:hypothetical protein
MRTQLYTRALFLSSLLLVAHLPLVGQQPPVKRLAGPHVAPSPVKQPDTHVDNPGSATAWSISKVPDPWVVSTWLPASRCTAFSVTTKDSQATHVRVYSTLVEQTTKQAITMGDLQLCRLGERCSGGQQLQPLNAKATTDLQICTRAAFHGTYHGAVVLASQEKPQGDTILQTAQFSSFAAKLAGCLLIFAGVYLAWWSKVWSRARIERDQALMPVVLMRSQLAALQQALAQLPPPYRQTPINISGAIQVLLGELADTILDEHRFLPPTFPNPYGYAVDAAGYKAYLEARNPRIQLLSILVQQGVRPAAGEDNGALTPAQRARVTAAIQQIDAILAVIPAPSPDQALARAIGLVHDLHVALYPPAAGLVEVLPAAPPSAPVRQYDVLQLEVQSISKGIWLLYGILTALSGLAVLILNNPGFGVPLDFVFVFFWGFGLPTTAQALAPGSAATALNISIAKS